MKRELTLAVMLMVISGGMIKAQSVDDIFIIGTCISTIDIDIDFDNENDDYLNGFIRCGPESDPIYETPHNSFSILSEEKRYFLLFFHNNFKQSERLKIVPYNRWDYMKTVTIPKSELSKFNLTDANKFVQEKSQSEAWRWARDVKESKKGIWVIDRNDNFVRNGVEFVILYEVYLDSTNEPQGVPEDEVSE